VASGVRDTDQSLTKIQPKFHLNYSAYFFLGSKKSPQPPKGTAQFGFSLFSVQSHSGERIARGSNLQQKFNLNSILLTFTLFVFPNKRKGIDQKTVVIVVFNCKDESSEVGRRRSRI
jgi:hypothetical protein